MGPSNERDTSVCLRISLLEGWVTRHSQTARSGLQAVRYGSGACLVYSEAGHPPEQQSRHDHAATACAAAGRIIARTDPSAIWEPSKQLRALTVPAQGARTVCSVFMASRITTASPSSTRSPSLTRTYRARQRVLSQRGLMLLPLAWVSCRDGCCPLRMFQLANN